VDYYEISVAQFTQQMLPTPLPATVVWGYGPASTADPNAPRIHHAPSLTIEATQGRPVRVKWINGLVDRKGRYRPHLLPIDPTVHWANPGGGVTGRDGRESYSSTPGPYTGPVPIVTHVHGAVDVGDESDGYAEAWFLPDAKDIPRTFARAGTWYSFFRRKARRKFDLNWGPGFAVFQYPNAHRASTSWFHDHALGMTRLNVYAGPAGFYTVRGGAAGDAGALDSRTGQTAVLPGPAPRQGDPFPGGGPYYEIPLAIQDRSFNDDGSLFYPDSRQFFDQIAGPYVPKSDLPPIWNPEFFGNTIIVNGATWPTMTVEKRRYRLRLLNGCNSRFLIVDSSAITGATVWQIGNEGGFLQSPVDITGQHGSRILLGPAERADIILDFTNVPEGDYVLGNLGPDEPFGGGEPGVDFPPADPHTTGQIMQFHVIASTTPDPSTPAPFLTLPSIDSLSGGKVRKLAILEEMSKDFNDAPIAGEFGTVDKNGHWTQREWMAAVTENPQPDVTEVWELFNATADAHPIHIHAVNFQVVDRQPIHVDEVAKLVEVRGTPRGPEPWELGWKDTVVAYPGEVTRIRLRFGTSGQYVWHCHILEHEDNEMMRPLRVGPEQAGQPKTPHPHRPM
jgi:FtsP/CotA-like multicopper oxidase with cupredoxin domain